MSMSNTSNLPPTPVYYILYAQDYSYPYNMYGVNRIVYAFKTTLDKVDYLWQKYALSYQNQANNVYLNQHIYFAEPPQMRTVIESAEKRGEEMDYLSDDAW